MSTINERPYIFYELTNSLCSLCLKKVEAKIVFQDEKVYMIKTCLEHGIEKVLISIDVEYYKRSRNFLKPPQTPLRFNTATVHGCPYDCGLCPDHEQHSCLTLIEIAERCNLTCPVCYADSSPEKGGFRSLGEIEFMLDELVKNEGEPDVVQLSGGEPTIHPQFFEIMDAAKLRPIRHLMVNTNGIRLAKDREFVKRLAQYKDGFEVYLQFDSLKAEPLKVLRGEDLRQVRRRALDHLNEFDISTTLVVTLQKGLNDGEIGDIIDFALKEPAVRGVTFQPVQSAGRLETFDPASDRLTLSEVRQQILSQSKLFSESDILPVPCHPDCIAMAYALKLEDKVVPLSGLIPPEELLKGGNTIQYEKDPVMKEKLFQLFSLNQAEKNTSHAVGDLLCCLPKLQVPTELSYRNIFRVIIIEFLDRYNFDVRSVKRACVHIVHPDGRIIPFDTYNMFYRENLDVEKIAKYGVKLAP
ncbi:MAG: radical SAM protein [Candidatus Obscuribacter phosphatis]|uniref:Radical SAM protein n=1 Tax=Candidatus Obscuribacter phosphatis TaxID=1906157 RepID=A0A8J7PAN9_9BACT|nr:radical SAM protein [Candidatus Obscuribacter phosphatis]